MNREEAQVQLEMVDRIIRSGDRTLHIGAELYVTWGVVSAIIDVFAQLAIDGKVSSPAWAAVPIGALLAGTAISIARSIAYRRDSERMTFMQREYLNVLMLSFSLAAVASFVARNLFLGWGAGAVWTVAAALVTFYVGLHNNRSAQIGGIVLLVSLIAANFVTSAAGYILAAGMLVGYAGFGISALLARE